MLDFAERQGRRSSQTAGRTIFSAAASAVDPNLADRIAGTPEWRKGYLEGVRDLVAAGVRSPKDAFRIAGSGLSATRENVVATSPDGDRALSHFFSELPEAPRTESFVGHGDRKQRLEVPYRGSMLRGDSLRRKLDEWVRSGTMEPSAATNLGRVLDNPAWLDLGDTQIVVLGGASEMGPLEALCSWGAHVLALDLPRKDLWDRIVAAGRAGSGRLSFPVTEGAAGIDLLEDPSAALAWLSTFEGPMTVGNYVYADGSRFVLLSVAVDALLEELLSARSDASIAYLATPTDVFAVTGEVVEAARRPGGPIERTLHRMTGGYLYEPSYQDTISSEDGKVWGIYDCLVPQQGANYALAKAIQRWRAMDALGAGRVVSANVAPATRTKSVMKNRILAAAYAGARRYGIEIFEPATSRALMAALLVHDLREPAAPGGTASRLSHPYELLADGAVHGGLWRLAHAPRSVLPLAVGRGLLKRKS